MATPMIPQDGRFRTKIVIGRTYGMLTALALSPGSRSRGLRVLVRCACGVEKNVYSSMLLQGKAKSCGCNRKAAIAAHKFRHGYAIKTNGSSTSEYQIWLHMKDRCHNRRSRSYVAYGAKGLTVCQEWYDSFDQFIADMGPKPSTEHSIDRRNPHDGYHKNNCRWATRIEQRANQLPSWDNLMTGVRYGFYKVDLLVAFHEPTAKC